MRIYRAYKTELSVNNEQRTLLKKYSNGARWAYNFALARKKEVFDKNREFKTKTKIPNNIELHRELNKLKGTEKLPWAYEISKCVFQEGLKDCDAAFSNFLENVNKELKVKKVFLNLNLKKEPHYLSV